MILVIRSIVGQGAKLAKDLKPGSSEIALSQNTTAWQAGDFVVLSDAQRVLLDQIAAVHASMQSGRVSLVKPIPFAMPVGSVLHCYQFDAYYVGEDAASTTGLYRLNTQGQRQELFADIDQFTLAIGLYDQHTHIWRYVAPEYVKNWRELASIKLALGAQLPNDRAIKTSAVISLEGHG